MNKYVFEIDINYHPDYKIWKSVWKEMTPEQCFKKFNSHINEVNQI